MPSQSPVRQAIGMLKSIGVCNIELGSIHCYEEGLISFLKQQGSNYLMHNFFPPPQERFILNIASVDEGVRRKSLDFIRNSVDVAEEIGCRIYTIHPGFISDPEAESASLDNYDFQFASSTLSKELRQKSWDNFFASLIDISFYVKGKKITVALETQGSVSKKDFMLFSTLKDFFSFLNDSRADNIGVNLNLAHLNLSSKAWGYDMFRAIDMLKPRIKAVEVSHSDSSRDSHQALAKDGWYIDLLRDDFFKTVAVIFEGRDLSLTKVEQSYQILNDVCG